MFDRFTEGARKVMEVARAEAQGAQLPYVGTEHLLLGLAQAGDGAAGAALARRGLDAERIRREVEAMVREGTRRGAGPDPHFTPLAARALERAVRAAQAAGRTAVASEDLLVGVLDVPEGLAVQALGRLGVARDELRGALAGPHAGAAAPAAQAAELDEHALRALHLARQEALRLQHDSIGTEHLLLGLVEDGSGCAATVLKAFGLDAAKVRREVERRFPLGPRALAEAELAPLPRVEGVQQLAAEEAAGLGDHVVGSGHLLLGLIRDEEGPAARILVELGVKPAAVRVATLRALHEAGTTRAADRPPARPPGHGRRSVDPRALLTELSHERKVDLLELIAGLAAAARSRGRKEEELIWELEHLRALSTELLTLLRKAARTAEEEARARQLEERIEAGGRRVDEVKRELGR